MSLSNKAFNAASWQFLSVISQAVLQLIVLAILARQLSPEDFGLIAITNIILMFAMVMSQGSIRPAVIQAKLIDDNYIRVSFTLSLLLAMLMLTLIWMFSEYLAYLSGNPQVAGILEIISISFFFNSICAVSEALLEKELNFKFTTIANIISYIIGFVFVGVPLALFDYGVWSLVYAVIVQSVVRCVAIYSFRPHNIIPLLSLHEVYLVTRFAGGSMLLWLFNYIALQSDKVIIAKWLGTSSLGIYNMAFTAMDMPRKFLGSIVEKVLFPSLSTLQSEAEKFKNVALKSFGALNLVMLPVSVVLIVIAPEIVLVVLGDKWVDVIEPLQILLVQIPFRSSIRISDAIVTAKGVLYRNVVRKIIFTTLVLVFAWIGHYEGLVGVAAGVTLAVFCNYILAVEIALHNINAKWSEFFEMLLPGIYLGISYLVISLLAVYLFDSFDLNSFLVILGVMILVLLFSVFLLFLVPRVYGDACLWFIRSIKSKLTVNSRVEKILKKIEMKMEVNS